MADTKGYAWRIFLFGLVASLPLIDARRLSWSR